MSRDIVDIPPSLGGRPCPRRSSVPCCAGTIATFGVRDACRRRGTLRGNRLTFVLDITGVHDTLAAAGDWNAATVSVTFVPVAPPPDDPEFARRLAAAPAVEPDLRAARIAVLVS